MFFRLGFSSFAFLWQTFSEMEASIFMQSESVSILGCKILSFSWYIILGSHEEFLSCVYHVLFSWVLCGNVHVILMVHDEDKTRLLVVKYFFCVGNFGFTTPIQDYGSGPATPGMAGGFKVLY